MEDGLDTGLALGMILSCHDSVSGCGRARWASAASFFLRLCVFASSLKSGLPLKPSQFSRRRLVAALGPCALQCDISESIISVKISRETPFKESQFPPLFRVFRVFRG